MKLTLDPGHGGNDSGATFNGLKEAAVVLPICLLARPLLMDMGHQVHLTRENDVYVSLFQRVQLAATMHSDAFISIHLNADADPDEPGMSEAMGSEIWVKRPPGQQPGTTILAKSIRTTIEERLPGEKFRGIKEARFFVLRTAPMAACLVELAFIDASETNRKLRDYNVLRDLAGALADGIHIYSQWHAL